MKTEKITRLSLLTAAALILFVVELQIPLPVPIAGVKLGLSNIVTLIAVYRLSARDAALILSARVLLGTLIGGNPTALLYSLSGAVFCMTAMLLLKPMIPERFLWLNSLIGAVFHNLGQLSAAALLLGSFAVFAYLPILTAAGGIAGVFTGVCAAALLRRFPQAGKKAENTEPTHRKKNQK